MSKKDTDLLRSILAANQMVVTYGMNNWYANGAVYTPEAIQKVYDVEMSDISVGRGGEGRIRPSLIGDQCRRKHILSFLGAERERPTLESFHIMNSGTTGHYRWQKMGLSAGWLTDIEVKVAYAPWRLAGSMDGLLSDGSGFELKTTNGFAYASIMKKGEPKWEHLMQVHAYMKALDINEFSVVYENRDNLQWREFRVKQRNDVMEALESLMEELLDAIDGEIMPEMIESCLDHRGPWGRCDFKDSCPITTWPEAERL